MAVEQHSLTGFTENILSALEKCDTYLFIDFRREHLRDDENENTIELVKRVEAHYSVIRN